MQLDFLDLTPEFLYGETASGDPSFTSSTQFLSLFPIRGGSLCAHVE